MRAIDTEGLDEQIRCEMCRNPMHTDRGCDGNCKYDEKLYERIMQILGERIKPLPSVQSEQPWTPCSELLPKEKVKYYWVCTDSGWQGICLWTNNAEELWRESDKWGWSACTPPYTKVVAWMPLPEPYNEVEDAEIC